MTEGQAQCECPLEPMLWLGTGRAIPSRRADGRGPRQEKKESRLVVASLPAWLWGSRRCIVSGRGGGARGARLGCTGVVRSLKLGFWFGVTAGLCVGVPLGLCEAEAALAAMRRARRGPRAMLSMTGARLRFVAGETQPRTPTRRHGDVGCRWRLVT